MPDDLVFADIAGHDVIDVEAARDADMPEQHEAGDAANADAEEPAAG